MKVLYSTMSVVEYDGLHYYNNPIKATYKRYYPLGTDITVMCFINKVSVAKQDIIEDSNLHFVFVEKTSSLRALLNGACRRNDEIIKSEVKKADVCVLHVPCFHNYQVIKYARMFGKPFITVVCASAWDEYWTYDWRGKIVAPYASYKLKQAQKVTDYSIYVTRDFLQKKYPNRSDSISCSNVNIHTGVDGVLDKRLEHINGLMKSGAVLKIGTVAPLDIPYKGQIDVIRALAKLSNKFFRFEYHLLGKGDNSKLVRAAQMNGIGNIVHFHSSIPHEKVLDFYDSLDIYIHPSRTEGLPRAVIEAMSRGCLCVGSDAGGIPELIENKLIFPRKNVESIIDILNSITIDEIKNQAVKNYEAAKKFDVNLLNERRKRFIESFKATIKK